VRRTGKRPAPTRRGSMRQISMRHLQRKAAGGLTRMRVLFSVCASARFESIQSDRAHARDSMTALERTGEGDDRLLVAVERPSQTDRGCVKTRPRSRTVGRPGVRDAAILRWWFWMREPSRLRFDLCPHERNQRLRSKYFQGPLQVVGENVQTHFSSDPRQGLGQKMG
jgi:hypothetical protein